MFNSRPKRQVPKPEVAGPHRSENPMFSEAAPAELKKFRRNVLSVVGLIAVMLGGGLAVYGPWLTITEVTVGGTRVLNPHSIKAVTDDYLQGQQWFVVPRRNLWLVSGKSLGEYLVKKISRRLSIESVSVTKRYPHRLDLQITERTPIFDWSNGQSLGSLDRQGVLIELRPTPDPGLDVVRDELATPIQPDQHLVAPEVVAKIVELQTLLSQARLTVKEFIIPLPTCPIPLPPEETLTTQSNTNNANSPVSNNNLNTNTPMMNSNQDVTNTGNINDAPPVIPPCDLVLLRLHSQELHVQLKDGPRVLFDRHENLTHAVSTLQRLLSQPANAHVTYIDIRFEERVFIK